MLQIHKYTLAASRRTVQVEFLLTQVLCVCGLRTRAMAASQSNVRQSEDRVGRRKEGPGLVRLRRPHSLTQLLCMCGGLPLSRRATKPADKNIHRRRVALLLHLNFSSRRLFLLFFFLLLLCSPSLVLSFSLFRFLFFSSFSFSFHMLLQ